MHRMHSMGRRNMNILHVGASGLVGRLVLDRLLSTAEAISVVAPTRRPLAAQHPKLHNPLVDFDHLPADADWWAVDAVICTLGTTIGDAGSQAAFRHVDFDYPLQVARLAHQRGASVCVLNSALGANARSRIFYNRVKGDLEDALAAVGFTSLTLVRPGLIDGVRAKPRPGEGRALALSRLLQPLLPKQWQPSRAEKIAEALVAAALEPVPGRQVIEARQLA